MRHAISPISDMHALKVISRSMVVVLSRFASQLSKASWALPLLIFSPFTRSRGLLRRQGTLLINVASLHFVSLRHSDIFSLSLFYRVDL